MKISCRKHTKRGYQEEEVEMDRRHSKKTAGYCDQTSPLLKPAWEIAKRKRGRPKNNWRSRTRTGLDRVAMARKGSLSPGSRRMEENCECPMLHRGAKGIRDYFLLRTVTIFVSFCISLNSNFSFICVYLPGELLSF